MAGVVDLVGHEQRRDLGAAQHVGDLVVAGHGPGPAVDHEDGAVGLGQRRPDLGADVAAQGRLVGGVEPAGVDQLHGVSGPVGLDDLAVARDARRLVDDGDARAAQAVDEGGLSGVGNAHHGERGDMGHARQSTRAAARSAFARSSAGRARAARARPRCRRGIAPRRRPGSAPSRPASASTISPRPLPR